MSAVFCQKTTFLEVFGYWEVKAHLLLISRKLARSPKGSNPTRIALLGVLCSCKERLNDTRYWFKSFQPVFFWCSLQSKETQKVHQHFCLENRKNGLRNSCVAALKPVFKLKKPEKPRKAPKGRKKTQFALVDKLRFFSGLPDRIRTCGLKSRSLALYPAGLRVGIGTSRICVQALYVVDPKGFEPSTSALRTRRSPN